MDLIASVLAPGIFGAEMEDTGQPVFLGPGEEAQVATAAPKRRREFALGRACARAALAALGHDTVLIGRRENGAPLWPNGVVGSITHTTGYAAALVAKAGQFAGAGLDAERVGRVTSNLWPRLFDAVECEYLERLNQADCKFAATLFFCAKEASYKAWGIQAALPFREIRITRTPGGFTAARSGETLKGRFAVQDDLLLAATWF
jgi:4'-phosphopantetheinyl transferase EntD